MGTDCSTHGRFCYTHHICGSLLTLDVVVNFQRLQIFNDCKERSVIAAYHVIDGIDSCCIGFHKRELKKFSSLYKGMLAHASSVLSDYSFAGIISCLPEGTISQITINRVDDTGSDES